jgi:hypothetical protein
VLLIPAALLLSSCGGSSASSSGDSPASTKTRATNCYVDPFSGVSDCTEEPDVGADFVDPEAAQAEERWENQRVQSELDDLEDEYGELPYDYGSGEP